MDRTDARVNMINDRYSNQKQKILHHLERFGSISPLEHYNTMDVCDLLLKYLSSKKME